MPRTLTVATVQQLMAQETGDTFIQLVEMTHPTLAQPIRVSSNGVGQNIISNGNIFYGWNFDIQIISDKQQELPRAEAILDIVDPTIVQAVQSIATSTPLTVKIQFVRAAAPDTVEVEWSGLALRGVTADAAGGSMTGALTFEDILTKPMALQVIPASHPGVFG